MSYVSGRVQTQQMLSENPDLDCICYFNDDVAFRRLCYCLHSGLDAPDRGARSVLAALVLFRVLQA